MIYIIGFQRSKIWRGFLCSKAFKCRRQQNDFDWACQRMIYKFIVWQYVLYCTLYNVQCMYIMQVIVHIILLGKRSIIRRYSNLHRTKLHAKKGKYFATVRFNTKICLVTSSMLLNDIRLFT